MRPQGITAYILSCGLATLATSCTVLSFIGPWLSSKRGYHIYLTHYCLSKGVYYEFPEKRVCQEFPGFCAAWKTATFGIALSICMDLVVLAALGFSWVASRRKKVALVVRWLAAAALAIDFMALQTFWTLWTSEKYFDPAWKPTSGPLLLGVAAIALSLVFALMFFFRELIKGPVPEDHDSSDEDDDADTLSIEEDFDDEQRDFYLFNKQARRQALRGG